MKLKFNPFSPDKIITPELFVGRIKEIFRLEKALLQAKHQNPTHFAIVGDRGIGKSSLCLLLTCVSRGEFAGFSGHKFSFAVVSISLSDDHSESDIICAMGVELNNVVKEINKVASMASKTWDFLTRWEVLGVAYHEETKMEARAFELLDELGTTIAATAKRLTEGGYDGILFLLDEADKPASNAHLGRTLKLLTEKLTRKGCSNVLFGLSGLPELFEKLKASHESSPRVFEPIELLPFVDKDQLSAIDKGLAKANIKNDNKTVIIPEAALAIAKHAEGFPHFLQQFAYSAFEADTNDSICAIDVEEGTTRKGGAIDALGLRYFRDAYWANIGSDDYRSVLKAMAQDGKSWVTKKAIRERLKITDGKLSNAINALKEKRAIIPRPGKPGYYRLPSAAFATWILREKED